MKSAEDQQVNIAVGESATGGKRRIGNGIITGVEYASVAELDQCHHCAGDMSRLIKSGAAFAERNLLSITDARDRRVEELVLGRVIVLLEIGELVIDEIERHIGHVDGGGLRLHEEFGQPTRVVEMRVRNEYLRDLRQTLKIRRRE